MSLFLAELQTLTSAALLKTNLVSKGLRCNIQGNIICKTIACKKLWNIFGKYLIFLH